jgi:hypothetical protein
MENELKLALFLGGVADNQTRKISQVESRLQWHGSYYLSRGETESEKFGTVWIYVLEGMSSDEEKRRVERINSHK